MIGVLVSGEGTNLQALIDAGLPIAAVASNRGDAGALARADEARPDLVLSDIGLPGENGLALMAELKRRYDVAGVAVSGHPIAASEWRDAGFVAYRLKPIRVDQLLQTLDAAVRPMSAATSLQSCRG